MDVLKSEPNYGRCKGTMFQCLVAEKPDKTDGAQWVNRGTAETDPAGKQVIPYVILRNPEGRVLAYPRQGRETRLHELWSVGIGGHVERADALRGDGWPAVLRDSAAREVADVTGAGDTVVAVVALVLAYGAGLEVAARLANVAAGIVVGGFGTVAVTREQLLAALASGAAEAPPRR